MTPFELFFFIFKFLIFKKNGQSYQLVSAAALPGALRPVRPTLDGKRLRSGDSGAPGPLTRPVLSLHPSSPGASPRPLQGGSPVGEPEPGLLTRRAGLDPRRPVGDVYDQGLFLGTFFGGFFFKCRSWYHFNGLFSRKKAFLTFWEGFLSWAEKAPSQ